MSSFIKSSLDDFFLFLCKEEKRTSVEDTIPIKKIYDDGICYSLNDSYSKVICFEDINYELLDDSQRQNVFNNWGLFLNSFNKDVNIQFLYMNRKVKEEIEFNYLTNEFQQIREEYFDFIKSKIPNNKREMFIIVSVKSKTLSNAKIFLERIESEIINTLLSLKIKAWSLNRVEYLSLINKFLYPNDLVNKEDFYPNVFKFQKDKFKMGSYFCISNHILILASELTDRFLTDILSINENIFVSIHLKSINQVDAIKKVKTKNSDIQKMVIDSQQKAIRSGYDIDILPIDLTTFGKEVKILLNDLQDRDVKLFEFSITIMALDKSNKKLQDAISKVSSICNKYNCTLKVLDYMQEDGFLSVMPIGINKSKFKRDTMTTTGVSAFMPFKTKDLFQDGFYYGVNPLSKNLIIVDRKNLKNPNGLILGTPGSGKSFSAKREIVNSILLSDDDIVICDPESEYNSLVKLFNGEIIKVSAKSKDYLNPLDIDINCDDIDDVIKDKSNCIMSILDLVVDGGLTAIERSIIDRCLPRIYHKYFENPIPINVPILQDLYNALIEHEGDVGKKLATEMAIYVTGTLNVFNHHSNVDLSKKLICFDTKDLNQLKKIGMIIVQEQVWNKVSKNRNIGRSTRYYIDEFHLLLKDVQTASYSAEMWKRFRKWGGIPTGITQNTKDLLASKEIENIFDNTDFILMCNQAGSDKDFLTKKLNLSQAQVKYITNANAGSGLLFYGDTLIPYTDDVDDFYKDTILYKNMTTKLDELK